MGAEGGIITDQTGGADIQRTGKVKLNLKSDTAFTAAAPNPTEVSGRVYPVALDSAGHPAVGVPWTDTTYTQAANSAITVDNTNHTIGVSAGTTSAAGVVQLTDSYTSTSTTTAATPNAVKAAYDLADSKYAKPNTGISKEDLEDGVQTSLGLADTALQTFTETDPTVPSWAKASSKPSYTASEVGAIATTAKGANNGVAELDANGKVPSAQLPSYVDDVLEYSAKSSFPATGETGKIYIDTTTNKTYRWGGSAYAEISESLALGDTSSTAYYGDKGKTAYEHSQVTSGNPHNVTATEVGLGNVGNFKAVSTVASQGLSNTEKSNARANIGAGTGNGTYSKPSGGIPKTDLASAVQTSLGLADGALQHTTVSGSPDLDTYLTTGVYHIATSTATHAPTTNHATLIVDATVGTPYQIFKPDTIDTTWYTRHRSGSTWTAWVAMKFTDTTYSAATTSAAGLMSAADKTKLNGIAAGAQVNSITGVKGNAESSYRTGNVNLTPANIGAAAASDVAVAVINPSDFFTPYGGGEVLDNMTKIFKQGKHIFGLVGFEVKSTDPTIGYIKNPYRPAATGFLGIEYVPKYDTGGYNISVYDISNGTITGDGAWAPSDYIYFQVDYIIA